MEIANPDEQAGATESVSSAADFEPELPDGSTTASQVDAGLYGENEWEPKDPARPPEESPVARHGWLSVDGLNLVNAEGDPIQLRGVSSQWLNWDVDEYATNKQGMQFLRDNWGLTVFRAAMGVEESGGYLTDPSTMRSKVRRIVQNAIDLGVYVLVDWHDHNAYLNTDRAIDFFSDVVDEFGQYPNVLYEPFNEPLHPKDVSWSEQIKPYYEAVLPVIRGGSPNSVVILGTPQWCQLVEIAALDPVVGDNLMYALHFFSCTHTDWLRETADAAMLLGAPIFVTEWAATTADGGVLDKTVCADEAMLWHQWMNQNNVSWIAWQLDSCTDASCLLANDAPASGAWDDAMLQGQGAFIRERMLEPSE